jgi:hypothetical protein
VIEQGLPNLQVLTVPLDELEYFGRAPKTPFALEEGANHGAT